MTTINFDLALAASQPAEQWLDQVDRGVEAVVGKLTAARRHREAWTCMAAHLAKTEVRRTQLLGPGPEPAAAAEEFNAAAASVGALRDYKPVGGVNVTASGGWLPDPERRAPHAVPHLSGEAERVTDSRPVSLRPRLRLVPPAPTCGHVSPVNGMVCALDPHPGYDDHYYVNRGSR